MSRTPLHNASAEGMLECAKVLLNKGADPNLKDSWDATPLDDALRFGHKKVETLLLENGAQMGNLKASARRLFQAIDDDDSQTMRSIDAGQVSIELGSPMPRPRTAPATPPAAAPAAANSIITNELLSMKIDLILQGLQSQAATSAGTVSPGRSISTPSASRPLALPAHLDSTTD